MNNLHRELAPISDAAWSGLEEETRRTYTKHVAARRAVDFVGPGGVELASVSTGHLRELEPPHPGVRTRARLVRPLVELRVPFRVARAAVDDVERGARDADWQPAKDAAKLLAFAEDRAVVDGFEAAAIDGIRPTASNPPIDLPADAREYPTALARAMTALRLAGVGGPYALLLSADAYTAVAETTDHGYPIAAHLTRLLGDGSDIIWAPAIDGGLLLSTRGGDYELHVGQDVSIGYLSHDATTIELYLQESLTFLANTAEAAVALR
jgi:uncharacterized linocin/CFP29 family protein